MNWVRLGWKRRQNGRTSYPQFVQFVYFVLSPSVRARFECTDADVRVCI